jgi:hypothetical protein
MKKISSIYNWKRLTPDDGHYFFGYYDRNPWNADQSLHLMMKINQMSRLPLAGETAEVGTVTVNGNYQKILDTRAWCHQQGCMELFYPGKTNQFIYNDFDPETGKLQARVYEIGKGEIKRYNRPIYALAPNGKFAVTLDIGRIPRRGYSYADTPGENNMFPQDLDNDGLWMIDLATGEERLIASYRAMLDNHPYAYSAENKYIWLNHIIFNCDSTRILWLFRSIYQPVNYTKMWQTFMYTSALDGHDVKCSLPEVYWTDMISHQIWGRTPYEIMVDANWEHSPGCFKIMVYDDRETPFRARKISDCHGMRAHLVYSPDGRFILADSYPDEKGFQTLMLVNADTGKCVTLGKFLHNAPAGTIEEKRCDLHPRWNPSGTVVTIDSIVSGKRAIYLLNLEEAMRQCSQEA